MNDKKYFWIFLISIGCFLAISFLLVYLFLENDDSFIFQNELEVEKNDAVQEEVLPGLEEVVEEDVFHPFSLVFVGDMMLGRYVETLMNQKGNSYPFEYISDFFTENDYVIGNLEGPIVANHSQTPNYTMRFSFDSVVADVLKENHFNLVTLANNHALDQGNIGFEQTREYLGNTEVSYVGHPREYEDQYVFTTDVRDQKFTFFGFEKVGFFDETQALDLIDRHVSEDAFDIVMIHWGNEYQLSSHISQQNLAHTFVDRGIDLVIGHHPHVVQEVEVYKEVPIFYSLGNFIFDQYFSNDVQEGLVIQSVFYQDEVRHFLLPIDIVRSQPQFMDEDSQEQFLEKLLDRSSKDVQESIGQGILSQSYAIVR